MKKIKHRVEKQDEEPLTGLITRPNWRKQMKSKSNFTRARRNYTLRYCSGIWTPRLGEETHWGTTGWHSLYDRSNDNSQLLADFASSKNLVIELAWFPHKCINKRTWASLDDITVNQIHHVFITKTWPFCILDVGSYLRANRNFNHYVVKSVFSLSNFKPAELNLPHLKNFTWEN